MKRIDLCWIGVFALASAFFSGCASEMLPAENMASIQKGEVLVIGEVEIYPPLTTEDQKIATSIIYEPKRNTYYAVLDDHFVDPRQAGISNSGNEYFAGTFGKPFYIRHPSGARYVNLLRMYRKYTSNEIITQNFAVAYKLEIRPGDRVVYVGTIRYVRDEFWDLSEFSILDQWDRVRPEFEKRFGKNLPVVKRLAVQLDKQGGPVAPASKATAKAKSGKEPAGAK